jgi:putative membrane protein
MTTSLRVAIIAGAAIASAIVSGGFVSGCASSQKPAPTAEEVRDGEALPPAPPVPAQPASTDSPTAPTVPSGAVAANPPPPAPAKDTLTDGQLARVSELVNKAEVEQAKVAQARSKSAAVRKFAAMMIKHHGDALREQDKLVKKLNVTPTDSSVAGALKADSEKTLDTLKKADAASFDSTYVQSQIDGHQKVLEVLDKHAPATATPELADILSRARTYVEQHLKEAQALQSK